MTDVAHRLSAAEALRLMKIKIEDRNEMCANIFMSVSYYCSTFCGCRVIPACSIRSDISCTCQLCEFSEMVFPDGPVR